MLLTLSYYESSSLGFCLRFESLRSKSLLLAYDLFSLRCWTITLCCVSNMTLHIKYLFHGPLYDAREVERLIVDLVAWTACDWATSFSDTSSINAAPLGWLGSGWLVLLLLLSLMLLRAVDIELLWEYVIVIVVLWVVLWVLWVKAPSDYRMT